MLARPSISRLTDLEKLLKLASSREAITAPMRNFSAHNQ
jgi:hypothetical protein